MPAAEARRKLTKVLCLTLLAALLLVVFLFAGISAWLTTPAASRRISLLLGDVLRQPAAVTGLRLTPAGLRVSGLSVANPPGFSRGNLLAVRSLTVGPAWSALIRGERRFRSVEIEGVRLNLEKNGAGEWNFSRFNHLWAGKKPAAAETSIRRLVVGDAAISINGQGVEHLSLAVTDFATKGSLESGISLDCKDTGGSPFSLNGKGRLGADPSATFSLLAPAINLDSYARLLRKEGPLHLAGGKGSLELHAALDKGKVSLRGRWGVERVHMVVKGERLPVRVGMEISAGYDTAADAASLDRAVVRLNDAVRLRASGSVTGVKSGERRFAADLALDPLDLADLLPRLPQGITRDLALQGRMDDVRFHLAGDGRRGITGGEGSLRLTGGGVRRKETLVCRGVTAGFRMTRAGDGWRVTGRMESRDSDGKTLVSDLSLPLSVRLSGKMGLRAADLDPFSVRLRGVPVSGEFHLDPVARTPCRLRAVVPETALVRFQQFVPEGKAVLGAGTATAEVTASGRTLGELAGRGMVRLAGATVQSGGKSYSLGKGDVTADFTGIARAATVRGNISLAGGKADAKHFDAATAFTFHDGAFTLDNGTASFAGLSVGFASIGGMLPRPDAAGGLPLDLGFSGMTLKQGEMALSGGIGKISAVRRKEGNAGWYVGNGTLGAGDVSFRGTSLGPCALRLHLDRGTGSASLTATPFGGHLEGTASADPADPGKGIGFSVKFSGLDGAGLDRLAGRREGWHLAGGRVGGAAAGTYTRVNGVSAAGELAGEALAVAAPGGKTAVSGAGLRLRAKVAGPDLTVERCILTAPGVSVGGHGELASYAAADRAGEFSVEMAATPVSAIMDDVVNLLPMPLQEATAGGTAAFRTRVRLKGKTVSADGALELGDASLDIPSSRLTVTGIRGTVPFSVITAGAHLPSRRDILAFSRENHPHLLAIMKAARGEQQLTIDRMKFSVMEVAGARFSFRAGEGVTELAAAEIPFFGGVLRGSGAFVLKDGPLYEANLLLADLSLRELCSAFPAIKGYISGKVDGIVSLHGEKGGVAGLMGFVDLWTRSGKGEERLVSKEFLQKLAGKNLKGFFFRNDRPYDRGEITAFLEEGFLTFSVLDISHTNFIGVRDLSVAVAAVSNRISLDHLFQSIKQAAERGKATKGTGGQEEPPPVQTDFKWQE